jgi:hypothetical protein
MAKKAKRAKGGARRKTKKRAKARATGAPALLRELKAYHKDLAARCAGLQSEVDAVSSAICAMEGVRPVAVSRPGPRKATRAAVARRGPRPAGTSLKDYIVKVLGGSARPVSVADLSKGVVRAGYKTKSRNLGNQISMALAQLAKARKVKKHSRGMYKM